MNDNIYRMLDELAEQADCLAVKDQYNKIRTTMQRRFEKQYAILGDVNSGKSTLINILEEEKRLPVSLRSGEHDKVAYVESQKHHCRWVEMASGAYVGNHLADADSPLWDIDAAVYVLSATAPFSQQDVNAIQACVTHGIPCSLVLSKIDVVDDGEKDEVIAYVKAQADRHFGSASVIVINVKDEEATRRVILNAFASAENTSDVRDYLLAISYAKTLKEHIAAKYHSAKEKMLLVSEREKQTKQMLLDEKIAWDKIKLEVEARKVRLVEAMSVQMNRLYADCIATLTDQAMLAKSPKDWWEQSLEKTFRREMIGISNKIDRMICSQVAADRDWLVKTVEQRFASKLSIDTDNTETQLEGVVFGVAPEKLNSTRTNKTIAMTGLAVSSIALCGVLAYPVVAMHSINALYWKIAGAAVAGTGFWTFFETKKERGEKQQCLRSEIARATPHKCQKPHYTVGAK